MAAARARYVPEQVQGADIVLDNFSRRLRTGELLVVSAPDENSVPGFLTRFTPDRIHVLARRNLLGYARVGSPGGADPAERSTSARFP